MYFCTFDNWKRAVSNVGVSSGATWMLYFITLYNTKTKTSVLKTVYFDNEIISCIIDVIV